MCPTANIKTLSLSVWFKDTKWRSRCWQDSLATAEGLGDFGALPQVSRPTVTSTSRSTQRAQTSADPEDPDFGLWTPGSEAWSGSPPKLYHLVLSHALPLQKILSKSIHKFASNLMHRQTNRQTDKQTEPKT